MGAFRRFVIGVAEFFQVFGIIIVTFIGGVSGYVYGKIGFLGVSQSNMNFAGSEVGTTAEALGAICGAIIGFTMSATVAALFFTLVEIAANTRKTALIFDAMARNNAAPTRAEPRL